MEIFHFISDILNAKAGVYRYQMITVSLLLEKYVRHHVVINSLVLVVLSIHYK